jgi:hypothetical protein
MTGLGSYLNDYSCLVCGEDMPKVRGIIPKRDYDQYTEFFDTTKDCYFVRFEESANLKEMHNANAQKLYQMAKEKMNSEMALVTNKEFKSLLENQMPRKLDEELKTSLDAFNDFVYFLRMDFQKGVPQSRYAVTAPCMKSALESVRRLGKPEYVMGPEGLKMMRLKVKLEDKDFTSAFPFVSENFKLDFLDSSDDSMTMEFAHFSKFPIPRENLR